LTVVFIIIVINVVELQLKIDKLITTNQVRSQLLEFQKLMNGAFKYTEKFRKEADKEVHQVSTNK